MLSFGGLLSIVLSGGSPGLNASNPGIVHILSGFVFPAGLVMWIEFYSISTVLLFLWLFSSRIVLQGLELLTSNMMVGLRGFDLTLNDSWLLNSPARCFRSLSSKMLFLGGVCRSTGSLVSSNTSRLRCELISCLSTSVTFGNLVGSLFVAAILVKCENHP